MKLSDLMNDRTLIKRRKTVVHKKEVKKRSSGGNSADDVLINESDRMTQYISEDNRQKIVSVRTAQQYGVNKIGSKNDPAGILKKMLIPETTPRAQKIASQNFFRMFHSDKIFFYSKNKFIRTIEYVRDGKPISYLMGLDVRTGKRSSIPARIKQKFLSGSLTEFKE